MLREILLIVCVVLVWKIIEFFLYIFFIFVKGCKILILLFVVIIDMRIVLLCKVVLRWVRLIILFLFIGK